MNESYEPDRVDGDAEAPGRLGAPASTGERIAVGPTRNQTLTYLIVPFALFATYAWVVERWSNSAWVLLIAQVPAVWLAPVVARWVATRWGWRADRATRLDRGTVVRMAVSYGSPRASYRRSSPWIGCLLVCPLLMVAVPLGLLAPIVGFYLLTVARPFVLGVVLLITLVTFIPRVSELDVTLTEDLALPPEVDGPGAEATLPERWRVISRRPDGSAALVADPTGGFPIAIALILFAKNGKRVLEAAGLRFEKLDTPAKADV